MTADLTFPIYVDVVVVSHARRSGLNPQYKLTWWGPDFKVTGKGAAWRINAQGRVPGGGTAYIEFLKTGLKHRPAIRYNRTDEPQAPACPLRGFVCPLCVHLLSAGV